MLQFTVRRGGISAAGSLLVVDSRRLMIERWTNRTMSKVVAPSKQVIWQYGTVDQQQKQCHRTGPAYAKLPREWQSCCCQSVNPEPQTQNPSLTFQSQSANPYAANLSVSCPRLQIPKLSELWPQPSKPQCSRSVYHMEAGFNHTCKSNIHTTTFNLQPLLLCSKHTLSAAIKQS